MNLNRAGAYTTDRSDIFDLVPESAIEVLDVGCSNGTLGASLMAANPNRLVTGIEFLPEFAREAESRLHRVLQADIEMFDWGLFKQGQFDCMIFADVLEHLRAPDRTLADALPHLRLGGHVVLSMPNIRHVSALWSIAVKGTFPRRDRGIFDQTHLRWFTLADARSLLRSQGLIIENESFGLRLGDKGGGRWNRLMKKCLNPVSGVGPVREFLTYQYCIQARK